MASSSPFAASKTPVVSTSSEDHQAASARRRERRRRAESARTYHADAGTVGRPQLPVEIHEASTIRTTAGKVPSPCPEACRENNYAAPQRAPHRDAGKIGAAEFGPLMRVKGCGSPAWFVDGEVVTHPDTGKLPEDALLFFGAAETNDDQREPPAAVRACELPGPRRGARARTASPMAPRLRVAGRWRVSRGPFSGAEKQPSFLLPAPFP